MGTRRRFEREVRSFLRRKGCGAAEADDALARLRELGLVADDETSRAFLRDRLRFAPKGRGLLLAELLAKGASATVAEAALAEVVHSEAEVDAAADFLRRSARKWHNLPEGSARRRMWAALARRGFPRETARQALLRVAGEAADDETRMTEEDGGGQPAPGEP
jgi:regulatory protein